MCYNITWSNVVLKYMTQIYKHTEVVYRLIYRLQHCIWITWTRDTESL